MQISLSVESLKSYLKMGFSRKCFKKKKMVCFWCKTIYKPIILLLLFQAFKLAKFEFNVTVNYGLWAICTQLWPLVHASKGILNLPALCLHLCSPFHQNRQVKIHHHFTLFFLSILITIHRLEIKVEWRLTTLIYFCRSKSLSNKQNNKTFKRPFIPDSPCFKFY